MWESIYPLYGGFIVVVQARTKSFFNSSLVSFLLQQLYSGTHRNLFDNTSLPSEVPNRDGSSPSPLRMCRFANYLLHHPRYVLCLAKPYRAFQDRYWTLIRCTFISRGHVCPLSRHRCFLSSWDVVMTRLGASPDNVVGWACNHKDYGGSSI